MRHRRETRGAAASFEASTHRRSGRRERSPLKTTLDTDADLRACALTAADRELRAARAVLLDTDCEGPGEACFHIARGWAALAAAVAPDRRPSTPQESIAVLRDAGFAPEEREPWELSLVNLAEAAARAPWDPAPKDLPSRKELLRQCGWLERATGIARSRFAVRLDPPRTGSSIGLRIALVGLMTVAAVAMVWPRDSGRSPVWRTSYYANADLSGVAAHGETDVLFFDWGDGSPLGSVPEDDFSANFVSCLVLGERTRIRFVLGSDDGSRLSLDGETLIDNWGVHDFLTAAAERVLPEGRYELRVEYFEKTGGARLALFAAIDGGPLEPIPSGRLALPRNGADACREPK